MAVFSKNEELQRQQVHIPMDQATGLKKVGMAALGYKATGERNLYGKITGYIPGAGGVQHAMARGIAGKADKSDYAKVLKSQDDAAISDFTADLKFGAEVAKLAVGGGVPGAGGGSGAGLKALGGGDTAGGAVSNVSAGEGIASEAGGIFNISAGGDIQGVNQEALDKYKEYSTQYKNTEMDRGIDDLKKESEQFRASNNENEEEDLDLGNDQANKGLKALEGLEKVDKLAGKYGGVAEAGVKTVQTSIAYNKGLEEEASKFKNKKKALSQDSLWM